MIFGVIVRVSCQKENFHFKKDSDAYLLLGFRYTSHSNSSLSSMREKQQITQNNDQSATTALKYEHEIILIR